MVQEAVHRGGAGTDEELLTIEQLAAATGLTVRTVRYYGTLGLLPAPVRRGRVAYYGPDHLAWLGLVRALQDHGFTLQAIERFVRDLPEDASVEDLALQKSMLTSWTAVSPESLTRRQLESKAGRKLSDDDLRVLELSGAIEQRDGRYVAHPHLSIGVQLLDLDVPEQSVSRADEAIRRHMTALADELTGILLEEVMDPFRRDPGTPEDARRMEETVAKLRQLTLEAVVVGFQRAANAVISRSLSRTSD